MIKLSAISPRTNAFMSSGGDPASEQVTFERMFTNLAYSALANKVPKLMNSVVTFKIIDSAVNEGHAQGTFVVQSGSTFIYVPVILNENSVEPPEVFYSKKLDAFLPLDSAWIDEVQKEEASSLGGPAELPEDVGAGLNITNMTIPPITGRVSYASAGINLPEFLESVPNRVKKAYASFLSNNPTSLKEAVRVHGNKIVEALRPTAEKVAAARPAGFYVLSPDDSPEAFRMAFRENAPGAFKHACMNGLAVKEMRKHSELSIPVDAQTPVQYQDIAESGVYKVLDSKGKVSVVAVFKDPTDIYSLAKSGPAYQSRNSTYESGYATSGPSRFLVVFPNGNYTILDKLVALPTKEPLPDGTLGRALGGRTQVRLRNGKQMLVSTDGTWRAVKPFTAQNISSPEPHTIRGDLVSEWSTGDSAPVEAGIVISDALNLRKPHSPSGSNTVFLPRDFVSINANEYVSPDTVVSDASAVLELVNSGIAKLSHDRISVKNCGAGEWSIDGVKVASSKIAVTYLGSRGLDVKASQAFISNIDAGQVKRAFVIQSANLQGLGRIFTKVADDTALVAQIAGSMAPAMFMQMQSMMQGQAPADPAAQAAGQQAAAQIDPATGQPMDPAMAQGAAPPMDPAMAQGAAPPMDPAMAQGAAPPMDPAMAQGAAPPMDPATGQPVGSAPIDPATGMPMAQPGQPQVDPTTGTPIDPNTGAPMDQPINPQFLNSAAELQQQGVFDVASVATLLQSPALTELVSSYLAPLEKSLDSLGRIVLAIKVKAPSLKQEIGQEAFIALDKKLTLVFRGLGELIIRLNQHTLTGVGEADSGFAEQGTATGAYGQ